MIIRPTTPQLLRDVRHELATVIEPEVQGPTARVTLEQIDIILEQCAVRSESEIAWMVEEIAEIESFADAVIAATGDERTAAALTAARSNASGSLHLDALADDYNRTSEVFSCAIQACMADRDQPDLLRQGIDMLTRQRADRETIIRANWRLVGRG